MKAYCKFNTQTRDAVTYLSVCGGGGVGSDYCKKLFITTAFFNYFTFDKESLNTIFDHFKITIAFLGSSLDRIPWSVDEH